MKNPDFGLSDFNRLITSVIQATSEKNNSAQNVQKTQYAHTI